VRTTTQGNGSAPAYRFGRWAPALLVIAGFAAYAGALEAPFLYDDECYLLENRDLQTLWPPRYLAGNTRPVLFLSFALDHALSGFSAPAFHLTNILLHLAAGLLLFALLRRCLSAPAFAGQPTPAADSTALAASLLWIVHPLATMAVTYVWQRGEILMACCYLLCTYAFLRGATAARGRGWFALAILACAAGMATKEVMVSAPLFLLLADRALVAGSIREALRRRGRVYAGLAATWLVLAALVALNAGQFHENPGVGFHSAQATPLTYARAMPSAYLHYLRLAAYPRPLVFDYVWPLAHPPGGVLLPAFVLALLVGATFWTVIYRPALGLPAALSFLVLAPTTSIMPMPDPVIEYRMYFPLAGIIVLAVLGTRTLLGKTAAYLKADPCLAAATARRLALAAAVAGAAILGTLTVQRNFVYGGTVSLWTDTVRHQPDNARARVNLGIALCRHNRAEEAIPHFLEALRLAPRDPRAHLNLGNALDTTGHRAQALACYDRALACDPRLVEAHVNLGIARIQQGDPQAALAPLETAVQLAPAHAHAQRGLAWALAEAGRCAEAIPHLEEALRLAPGDEAARALLERLREGDAKQTGPTRGDLRVGPIKR